MKKKVTVKKIAKTKKIIKTKVKKSKKNPLPTLPPREDWNMISYFLVYNDSFHSEPSGPRINTFSGTKTFIETRIFSFTLVNILSFLNIIIN